MEEKRKYPRVAISFPVECDIYAERNYFYTVTKDLSLAGIKIIAYNFLPKDYLMKIKLNLIDKILDLRVKVAWCNQMRISDRYAAGLEFMEITPQQECDISQFLSKINHTSV
jgi:c-di-GMP-binding flagellar brake protein YcgR